MKGFKEDCWREEAEQLCFPGLLAKFKSNECLKDMLLSTGNMQIVEATCDTMCGTGVPLHHHDCLDKKRSKNTGLLGNILMTIRTELQDRGNEMPMEASSSVPTSETNHTSS